MSTAVAHYYDVEDLVAITKEQGTKTKAQTMDSEDAVSHVLPPKTSRHFTFDDTENPADLHFFEASDLWREAGISCLSTSYEVVSPSGRRNQIIGHHYFTPSTSEIFLTRDFRYPLRLDEAIRVNERGVELIALGIYGRHAVWLVDRDSGPALELASLIPRSRNAHGLRTEVHLGLKETTLGHIDSLELDDAYGVLYATTSQGVYRFDLC